jgi:hypothetical protein
MNFGTYYIYVQINVLHPKLQLRLNYLVCLVFEVFRFSCPYRGDPRKKTSYLKPTTVKNVYVCKFYIAL